MEYRPLGQSELKVSALCLGTMTFGEQNTEAEAHQQLDAALAAGVNFIDTAEMYPVPPRAETQGLTEQYIGRWLKARGNRSQVILASKIAGPAEWASYIRPQMAFDQANIETALNASLKRLQTDYIDLYQLHWPERNTNYFGQLGYQHQPDGEQQTRMEETLAILADLVQQGKIRHIGLSNETPWGVMKFLQVADRMLIKPVVSIQNPYNLLNRSFEVGLAEIAHREQVGLLAYSPLAFGVLTGKYLNGAQPANARLTLFERFSRYTHPRATAATQAYCDLAEQHGLSPTQMALAYVTSRPFVTSNIIGATSMAQLEHNLASIDCQLPEALLEGIEAIHQRYTYPCP